MWQKQEIITKTHRPLKPKPYLLNKCTHMQDSDFKEAVHAGRLTGGLLFCTSVKENSPVWAST